MTPGAVASAEDGRGHQSWPRGADNRNIFSTHTHKTRVIHIVKI